MNVWPDTITVPIRTGPGFAATFRMTFPCPVPEPAVTVIHGAFDEAVQEHPGAAPTWNVSPASPAAAMLVLCGVSVVLPLQPSSWFTVKVWPATVMPPVRAGPGFAPTSYTTVPGPVPAVPETNEIHASLGLAAQGQPWGASTPRERPEAPEAATVALAGLSEVFTAQPSAWLMAKVSPATAMEPSLGGPLFGMTSNTTIPVPEPEAPAVMMIQASLDTAVHGQPPAT